MLELRETEINENVSVETVQTDVLYFFFTKKYCPVFPPKC